MNNTHPIFEQIINTHFPQYKSITMKRKIKFRTWDGKEMHLPEDIHFDIRNEFALSLFGDVFYFKEESNGHYCPESLEGKFRPDVTLMQFTGLEDKNENEIYEGDIFQREIESYEGRIIPLAKGEIVFHYGGFCMKHVDQDGVVYFPLSRQFSGGNVIGNIYEHPELLKLNNP